MANGRGFAVYGGYPVTVRGCTHGAQSSTFIYNYGTGKLSWDLTNSTCVYVSAGPGLTEFSQTLANTFYIFEGTTRLTAPKNFTEGTIYLAGNGVLELGADLNGTERLQATSHVLSEQEQGSSTSTRAAASAPTAPPAP